MKLYIYAGIFFTCVSLSTWIWQGRYDAGFDAATVATLESTTLAVEATRKQEQAEQEKINAQAKEQYDEIAAINNRLNDDLDKLRKRPNRISLPRNTSTECKGVTGKSLSAEDAGFLTREAARADKIRTALSTCYKYADTVASDGK